MLILPSAYSAHEFSTLSTQLHSSAALPLDIQIETLAAVALSCLGLVLGSEPLRPISWSTWAGKIEREGGPNPFSTLENRVGFMDIRVRRCEIYWTCDQANAGAGKAKGVRGLGEEPGQREKTVNG